MQDIPTFLAERIRGTNTMRFVCPKCSKANTHGTCGKSVGGGDGHRVSHCECWPNGYYVKERTVNASR